MITTVTATSGKPRYRFIDHYRGWAVLVMMETHSVNAWLADSYRSTTWFGNVKFLNGFVAPSFLFLAGVSFVIVARKRKFEFAFSEFFSQLRKFAWIWIVGYLLHSPSIQFGGGHLKVTNLAEFYKVDVLQTIAFGLIVLLLITALLHTRMIAMICLFTVAVIAATPFLWAHDFTAELHPFLANYLNGKHNPLFPLFPWVAFLWAGAITAFFFFNMHEHQKSSQGAWMIALAGALLFAVGYLTRSTTLIPYTNFWLDSPQWFLMRLGLVLLIFCSFFGLERIGTSGSSVMHLLGTKSLFAYVIHLLLIFNFTGPRAKIPIFQNRQLNPVETFVMFGVLAITVTLLTWLWKRFRDRKALSGEKQRS